MRTRGDNHRVEMAGDDGHPWRMLFTDASEFSVPNDLRRTALEHGITIDMLAGHDPDEIVVHGAECDGLYLFRARVDDALLARLPRCRLLARVGTGYDLIDVSAARRRGVMVTYVPDFCTEEMSDQVILFVLAFARRLPFILRAAGEHRWLGISDIIPTPRRTVGQTLGILGFGRTGRRTAEKARALGLQVRVWTRTPRPDDIARAGAVPATFEEVLGCNYISLHLPLTPETAGLIGHEALDSVAPTSVLINVARGAIVDTSALVDALREGRLAGAALDVIDPAPLPASHPLWEMPNVWITSHSASLSVEALHESLAIAIADTAAVRQGLPPVHPAPEMSAASHQT